MVQTWYNKGGNYFSHSQVTKLMVENVQLQVFLVYFPKYKINNPIYNTFGNTISRYPIRRAN